VDRPWILTNAKREEHHEGNRSEQTAIVPEAAGLVQARQHNRLHNRPHNVQIREFYAKAGAYLDVRHAQRNFVSCNYTPASRDLLEAGVNVVAQMVAPAPAGEGADALPGTDAGAPRGAGGGGANGPAPGASP